MDFRTRPTKERNVKPYQVIQVLQENGIECNEQDAKEILDFLYLLAKLAMHQYLNEKKD
ncbi:hypothetical protein [Mucilaginibacter sp.]|uniref:hypothetical protein n=1 Tax=Mucilaginibacter sp. TaxID=1882438 RepID=UPI003D0A4939